MVRPEAVGNALIENEEVIVRISKPALFTVDINGQMDDQVKLEINIHVLLYGTRFFLILMCFN